MCLTLYQISIKEQHQAWSQHAALVSLATSVIPTPSTRLILVQVFKTELELPQESNKPQVRMIAMDSTIEIDHGRVNLAGQARRYV
jgi:hypothetical protein